MNTAEMFISRMRTAETSESKEAVLDDIFVSAFNIGELTDNRKHFIFLDRSYIEVQSLDGSDDLFLTAGNERVKVRL